MPESESFQTRVHRWIVSCLGHAKAKDPVERNERFLEEALELVQSLGMRRGEAMSIVDYVYGRPAGDPPDEVGGVMTTLAALCNAHRLAMEQLGEEALVRNWSRVEEIRAKNAAKPKFSEE